MPHYRIEKNAGAYFIKEINFYHLLYNL